MLKGLYKTETCRYDAMRTCRAGGSCCFRHRVDNEHNISQRVAPIRREVFTRLYEQEFALPLEILHEINKISDQQYDIRQENKDEYKDRAERRRTKPRISRSAMSNSSNEQGYKSRTPTPPGAKRGETLEVEYIQTDISDASAERQRDNTSAGLERRAEDEDSDVEEAAAHIEANDDDIKMEPLPETEQTPLLAIGNGDGAESTPQLINEETDTAMALDPTIVAAVEAADADADMATGLPENIVDA